MYFNNGEWFTPSLAIVVSISNIAGKYKIWVDNGSGPVLSYETIGIDWGDVIHTHLVNTPGVFEVIVKKKKGSDWLDLPGTPVTVIITYPNGSPVITVLVNGW